MARFNVLKNVQDICKMKILNLYAGLGGNRKLWGDNHTITAIEYNPKIAKLYSEMYPTDITIVTDAHQYLLDHYKEFDFIWSSPPCQSHSAIRHNLGVRYRNYAPLYPDMSMYQEIMFLKHSVFEGFWVVENVIPYYKPLIEPTVKIQRHLLWSNFHITNTKIDSDNIRNSSLGQLQIAHGITIPRGYLKNGRQTLRNCVSPLLGKHVLDQLPK
jgi:DNA (cytosine-5)-methyltransferase 1